MSAAVLEGEAGAGDEVLDGARDEHLAGPGLRSDPRARVDGDPGDLAVQEFALAGVQAGAHLEPQLADLLDDRLRAADRPRGPVEAREEAVAGGVDLPAAEAGELLSHGT